MSELGFTEGFNQGPKWGSGVHRQWADTARAMEQDLEKALTTGQGIVQTGDTGGSTLRTQWLPGLVERASFQTEDAVTFKAMPKKKAYSTTIEQTFALLYGGIGSGFTPELGDDGAGNIAGAEDSFQRATQVIAFMAARREPGFVTQQVTNLENPVELEQDLGELELLGKANAACFTGDRGLDIASFNGLGAQIRDWVILHNERQAAEFDCAGQPLSESVLRDAQKRNRRNWGRFSRLIMSVDGKGDAQKEIYPKERFDGGRGGVNSYGVNPEKFNGDWSVDLVDDPMLQIGEPLAVDGPRADPSIPTAADAGAPVWGATPFTSINAVNPGAGFWRQNHNRTSDAAALTTVPALPPSTSGSGQQGSHLPVGTSYYAITAVYAGRESLAWVNGASAANTIAGAAAVTIAANKVVAIAIDLTTPAVTGLGSTFARQRVWYRIYRCDKVPNSLADFQFLMNVGAPVAGNAWGYDNGATIPGTDVAYGITERKGGKDMWAWLNLLPMAKRMLPNTLMTEPFGILLFGTPFLPAPHFHTRFRNVGKSAN